MKDLGTLYDPEIRRAPYRFFERLRSEAPVYQMPGTKIFVVSAHEIVKQVARDPKTFSNELPEGQSSFHNFSETADCVLNEKGFGRRVKTIASHDPPGQYGYRRIMSAIFTPELIRNMEPTLRTDVRRVIGEIDATRPCDLVEALTLPVPLLVLSDLLGVERANFLRFKDWAAASLYQQKPPQAVDELIKDAESIAELQHYLVAVIEDRRIHPRDDTVTKLVQAKLNDERPLTTKEILSTLEFLVVAGAETTTNFLGNSFLYLMDHPEVEAQIRSAPERISEAVEELLRLEGSVTGSWCNVTANTELAGVSISAGSQVLLAFGPCNWDESVFPDARAFKFDRPNMKDNYVFGTGIHTCLGNNIARMEMRVVFSEFFDAFSSMSLAVHRNAIEYQPFFTLRGPVSLPVKLVRTGR